MQYGWLFSSFFIFLFSFEGDSPYVRNKHVPNTEMRGSLGFKACSHPPPHFHLTNHQKGREQSEGKREKGGKLGALRGSVLERESRRSGLTLTSLSLSWM